MVDDDEEVKVGLITLGGMRLIDPAAARIAAVEDDLEDTRLLLPVRGGNRGGIAKFLEEDLHDALQLALLGRGQMIEVGTHVRRSYRSISAKHSLAGMLPARLRRTVIRSATSDAGDRHAARC